MTFLKSAATLLSVAFAPAALVPAALADPSIDPELESTLSGSPLASAEAIITFDLHPGEAELTDLAAIGITDGVLMNELPMVLTTVTGEQLEQLRANNSVLSIYGNETFEAYDNVSRTFIGQQSLLIDREVQIANRGVPVSGNGVGVAVVDTGIDGTHADIAPNLVQNVYFPLADASGFAPVGPAPGLLPPVFVEGSPMTDIEGGHGTFVTGNIAATGAGSGGFYGGVAPGAEIIGLNVGNSVGIQTFAIIHAYDWILANHDEYNIRVVNNSFGGTLGDPSAYDPFSPTNVATRAMHDRFITVIYAAGNDGDVPGAINRLAVAPWIISVAAGEKEGLGAPAGFSSRGEDNGSGIESAGHPADPNQPPNLRPDITGPGVNIKSTRSKGAGVTNTAGTALGQDLDIAPAHLPFYTTSQGTSFAAPHVAGVAALMLEANPNLTPQQIMQILRATAMPMPYEERVVGAGYVDAHNAVRMALNMAPVDPPANLIPGPDAPSIIDVRGDQLGAQAQDILSGEFTYDPATNQLVYELVVADLDDGLPNTNWYMASNFNGTTIFVTAGVNELGAEEYEYGQITQLPNGTNNQETLGEADSGELDTAADTVRIFLSVDKINAALGTDVIGTTSTAAEARTQILIGSSLTGGLLLAADTASGTDYTVGGNSGSGSDDEGTGPSADFCDGGVKERFPGMLTAGDSHEGTTFVNACNAVKARFTFHPGNQDLTLVLESVSGAQMARAASGNGKKIDSINLPAGEYRVRIDGSPSTSVDYVIHVDQHD